MCGITGAINFRNKVDQDKVDQSIHVLRHRGPDGNGKYVNEMGNVVLGHTRLSIIDLSTNGAQPMHKFERYHITFNGEIYNYIELKKTLIVDGYTFDTDTDTEVLITMYDKYGAKCLEHLDGMFSFVIYDERENNIFGARDRFGEKPFFYTFDGGTFSFASEIKALFPYGISKKWREQGVSDFLNYGNILNEEDSSLTFFEGIKRLKSAHYFQIDLNNFNFETTEYWSLNNIKINHSISFDEAKERTKELFMKGLKRRLRSDVQLGTSLSGGLDSSIVALSIAGLTGNEFNTYSARFKNFVNDEGEYMDAVANHLQGIKQNNVWLNQNSLMDNLESLNYAQDEPYGSASMLAQYMVMKEAKKTGTTVLLDGQGADEYFAGYFPYYRRYIQQLEFHDKAKFREELTHYNNLPNFSSYVSYKKTESIRMKLGRYKSTISGNHPIGEDHFRKRLILDCTGGHLQGLLRYGDRSSMAHSVESRLPYLYHKLVEFIFSLPDDFLLNKGRTKYILRESFSDILPEKITKRKDKLGFETPNEKWLKSVEKEVREKEGFLRNNFELKTKEIALWRSFIMSSYLEKIAIG
jgi:asparagine synthase (glutamine-hydrolysing)